MHLDHFNHVGAVHIPRLIFGTADDAVHCFRDKVKLWTLEESLTDTASSLLLALPMESTLSLQRPVLDERNANILFAFISRCSRHVIKFQVIRFNFNLRSIYCAVLDLIIPRR